MSKKKTKKPKITRPYVMSLVATLLGEAPLKHEGRGHDRHYFPERQRNVKVYFHDDILGERQIGRVYLDQKAGRICVELCDPGDGLF